MRKQNIALAATLVGLAGFDFGAASQSSRLPLTPVSRADLCVTEGSITESGRQLFVSVPKMRAYVDAITPQVVEVHFKYLGSTGNEARLGSGELRRQFGLKLLAQDGCNLVYAMWRIEPESKLVVSVKSNPSQHTSAECGNRGYRNIKPRFSKPVPTLRPGDAYTMRAELSATGMRVLVDDGLIWQGSVGPEVLSLTGPVGMRSDNARLELELRVPQPAEDNPEKRQAVDPRRKTRTDRCVN
ncbi:MAG TPA: hypothetical protein VEU94_18055 [Terriglobales bacterium]|nr:hypothetical protein [Terriglobales bacterium]